MSVDPKQARSAIESVLTAWKELAQYGAHEGPCDNERKCEQCGTQLDPCTLHIEHMNRRMDAMQSAMQNLAHTFAGAYGGCEEPECRC